MSKGIPQKPRDRDELYEIYDSMDFDRSGYLSLGEWAGGLSVFFRGTQEECVHAVFNTLDRDKSRTLTKTELQEYLKPFVKAMSPPQADALRPVLLKKATDDIYREMDIDHRNDISSEELLAWTRRGNNIIDKLADIIDKEVYRIWLAERERQRYANTQYSMGPNNLGYGGGDPRQRGQRSPNGGQPGSPYGGQGGYGYGDPGYGGRGGYDDPYAADPYGSRRAQSPDRGYGFGGPSPGSQYGMDRGMDRNGMDRNGGYDDRYSERDRYGDRDRYGSGGQRSSYDLHNDQRYGMPSPPPAYNYDSPNSRRSPGPGRDDRYGGNQGYGGPPPYGSSNTYGDQRDRYGGGRW
jgi:Ca2+-binding EF-hand superfamily protein